MACRFCEEMKRIREHGDLKEARNDLVHHEYGALILQISWNELAGRHHYSDMVHRPYPFGFELNYCPECGRKMNEREKRDQAREVLRAKMVGMY